MARRSRAARTTTENENENENETDPIEEVEQGTGPDSSAQPGAFPRRVDPPADDSDERVEASRVVRRAPAAQLARTGTEAAEAAFAGTALLVGGVVLVLAGGARRAPAHRA